LLYITEETKQTLVLINLKLYY